MAKRTVTYEACDRCGKVLERPTDGLVIRGQVYATGAQWEQRKPLVGDMSSETALCWGCWHHIMNDECYREVVADNDRRDRETMERDGTEYCNRGASGPLPPPELPRAVEVARALVPRG